MLAEDFVKTVYNYFVDNNYLNSDDIIIKSVDIYDFDKCMELVAGIFKKENDEHNEVSFNVSSGGHILS